MQTTYSISGMHCQACERKVQEALGAIHGVASAQVSLSTATATLDSAAHLPLAELQAAVSRVGDYRLTPTTTVKSGEACEISAESPLAKGWLQTYKPLLTIAAFIVGGTLLIAISTSNWQAMSLMNSFMGLFFVVFAFFKILDVPGFARAYRSYDVITKRWPAYGYLYPWIELTLGVSYLLGLWPLATNLVTLGIMSVSTVGVVNAVRKKQQIQCGCLGTVFELPMSTVTIVEDVLMAAMAASSLALLM
ncbi:MAG: cation transporter [Bythopirellula sp.]|nr:cation transporter [Bythopirellula sp.]